MNISTKVYKRCEIVLHSTKDYENPFMDVNIDAIFTHEDGTVITLPGFWNGDNEWKVRFASEKTGIWNYSVTCTDKENASLFDNGTITVEYAEPKNELEEHGYVTLRKGDRYLSYADGKPFFYLADTHWQMPDYEHLNECNYPGCNCGSQFKHVVDDRVKKGFTVYQTYFDSANSDGGGNERLHPWWIDRFTKINPQSFNETMDVMIEYLADKGITVAMGFGVHRSTISAFNEQAEPLFMFARYCVARYACYPVVWITAQEINIGGPKGFEIYREVGALVGKLDGFKRPNSAHIFPMNADTDAAKAIDSCDWHQWWALQAGHTGDYNTVKERFYYEGYYNLATAKPFIETECSYEDLSGTNGNDAPRIGAYQAVISGSAGFTYGVTGIWAMRWDTDRRGWTGYSPEPWYIGVDKPGSSEVGYMRRFFEYVGWTELTPSFDHTFGTFEMRKHVSICHKNDEIFIYYFYSPFDERGTITGLKKNVKYQMRWFDTVTGKFVELDPIVTEDGSFPIPKKPSKRDWLLLLNCSDLGEFDTEVYPTIAPPGPPQSFTLGDEIKIKALKASSFEEGYPAENLIDGNDETYWTSLCQGTSQTFYFDFEKEEDFAFIEFVSKNTDIIYIRFRIFGSNDGVNYDLLSEREGRTVAVGAKYSRFIDTFSGKYKHIKLFINSGSPHQAKWKFSKLAFYKKQ
jgi:hypothetical protein